MREVKKMTNTTNKIYFHHFNAIKEAFEFLSFELSNPKLDLYIDFNVELNYNKQITLNAEVNFIMNGKNTAEAMELIKIINTFTNNFNNKNYELDVDSKNSNEYFQTKTDSEISKSFAFKKEEIIHQYNELKFLLSKNLI